MFINNYKTDELIKGYKFSKILVGDEYFLTLIHDSNHIKDFKINYSNWTYNKKKIIKLNRKLKNIYKKKETEFTNKYNKRIYELRKQKSILGKHPKTYNKISKDEFIKMKNSKSFFYRKFSADSDISKYYKKLI